MRDAGEAIMNKFAINEARKPSRIGSLAVISGAMLGAVGVVGPALSADLPDDYPPPSYRPTYYQNYYNSGYSGCYSCGQRFEPVAAPPPVVERPIVERFPMAERHWVQRDYVERQYPSYAATTRYAYSSYPDHYRYSHSCPGPCTESYPAYEPAQPAPYREPPRRLSYVGAHYPPAPAAYEYESEPRAPYPYAASSHRSYDYHRPSYEPGYNPAYRFKPAYEHEPSPRPPGAVPGYYGPGYSE
jgi:hypothetical protein